MFPKYMKPESTTQSYINTRTRSKSISYNTTSNLDSTATKNSKSQNRLKRQLDLTNAESISSQLQTTSRMNDTSQITRIKRLDVSLFSKHNTSDINNEDGKNSDTTIDSSLMNASTNQSPVTLSKRKVSKTRLQQNNVIPKKQKPENALAPGFMSGLRKFSKSPRIVLKLPKLKSKSTNSRSSSTKLFLSKSLSSIYIKGAPELEARKSVCLKRKSDSDGISVMNRDADMHLANRLSSMKSKFLLKEAVVVLQKLPNDVSLVSSSATSQQFSSMQIQANISMANCRENMINRWQNISMSNSKKQLQKKTSNRHTLLTPQRKHQEVTQTARTIAINDCDTFCKKSAEPLMSSTPRNQEQERFKKNKTQKDSQMRNNSIESSKCDLINIRKENAEVTVKEQEQEEKAKDETYELIEPQTPNLRRKLQEKQNVDAINSMKKASKKAMMVRFTSHPVDTNNSYHYWLRRSNKGNEVSRNVGNRASLKEEILKSPTGVFRRKSNSVSGVRTPTIKSFTLSSPLNRKANSVTNVNMPSASRFTSPLKASDSKHSATKKVPNFAEIHAKMFAKSESVIDARKRLEERHMTLTAPTVDRSTRIRSNLKEGSRVPNELHRAPYNRFGYRIRKNDATEYILKKTNIHSARSKQLQQSRSILKGVRTNRRFELQMRARNINH